MSNQTETPNAVLERIAEFHHDIWSSWMSHMFACAFVTDSGEIIIPKAKVDRWVRQMNTKYSDLPEEEKESDRRLARKTIKLF